MTVWIIVDLRNLVLTSNLFAYKIASLIVPLNACIIARQVKIIKQENGWNLVDVLANIYIYKREKYVHM